MQPRCMHAPCMLVHAAGCMRSGPTARKCHSSGCMPGLKHVYMHAQNLDMLAHIRRELQREGYLKQPKAHLHASCSADAPRLQRIITQLGGELMASESARMLLYLATLMRQTLRARPCLWYTTHVG